MNSAKYFRKDTAYNIYKRLLPYIFDFQKQLSKDMLQNNWYETTHNENTRSMFSNLHIYRQLTILLTIHNENTRSMFSNVHIYRQLTTLFKSAALQKFCS